MQSALPMEKTPVSEQVFEGLQNENERLIEENDALKKAIDNEKRFKEGALAQIEKDNDGKPAINARVRKKVMFF